jgi:hypothetical protein
MHAWFRKLSTSYNLEESCKKKRSGRKIKVRYISSGGRQQFGACET